MITDVELVNFISHKKTSLPLGEGITVFVGKNGAGKSSVIDGITYALYGKHARGDNVDLVKDRADSAAVSLEFSAGGRSYRVERKINGKGQLDRSLLTEERAGSPPKQLAAGERKQFGESLTGEVTKILGLNYDQMIIAGVIQQGELDSIIDLKAKELKDLINSAIGIDRLDLAYDSMRDVTDSFRAIVRNKYGSDDRDLSKTVSRIAELEVEAQKSWSMFKSVQSELGALRLEEHALEQELELLEPLRQKGDLLRSKFETLVDYVIGRQAEMREERRGLEAEIEASGRYLALRAQEGEVKEKEQTANEEKRECEALVSDLTATIGGLDALRGRPTELDRAIKECGEALSLTGKADAIAKDLAEVERQTGALDAESARIQGEIGKLEANQATAKRLVFKDHICPICGSHVDKIDELFDSAAIELHLSKHETRIEELVEEKKRLGKEFKRLQGEKIVSARASTLLSQHGISGVEDLERLETEKRELQSRLEALPRMKEQQREARERSQTIEGTLTALRRRRSDIEVATAYLSDHKIASEEDLRKRETRLGEVVRILKSIPESLPRSTRFEGIGTLASLSIDDRSAALVEQVKDLHAEASTFDAEVYKAKMRDLDEVTKVKIPKKSGDAGGWKTGAEGAEEELGNLKATLVDLENASEFIGLLEKIRNSVYHRDGAVSTSVRSWALGQLSKKASEYARFFEIGVSSITIKETRREMEIECYGARGHIKTSSMSGGEKVAIALALRFALAYVMGGYKLDFIILDEPTVHLDTERKAKLVNIISRLGGEQSPLKQIIIITHDAEILENADVDQVWRFESAADGSHVMSGFEN
ncbi:MAG: SMC family ATPase [Nitrososphaerales archaeon]|jgi:exonuclease SbcC